MSGGKIMRDKMDHLVALQRDAGRLIVKYAKRRRGNRARLDGLYQWFSHIPEDLIDLYEYYDGAETPETVWEEHGYFFGHFMWRPSDLIVIVQRICQTRPTNSLSDEIGFYRGRRGVGSLLITPSEDWQRYVLTVGLDALTDIRYIAFDNLPAMIDTYTDALENGAWSFDTEGLSVFDDQAFLKTAARHNKYTDYWQAVADGSVDFGIKDLESGKLRPREGKVKGYEMLRAREIEI